jgi:hypothetical protein
MMSDVDVKNTLEQMFREGFARGFEAAGGDLRNAPGIRFEWKGRQPTIHINRPQIQGGGLWLPKSEQN